MTPVELYRAAFGAAPIYAGPVMARGGKGAVGPWKEGWRIWSASAEVAAPTPVQALRAWRALHGQDDPVAAVLEARDGELTRTGRHVVEWETPAGRIRVTLEAWPDAGEAPP